MTDNDNAQGNQSVSNPGVETNSNPATDTNLFGEYSTKAGFGTKYKSVEDLAKGKVHADSYIEQLKEANAEKDRLLQEALEQLKASANAEKVLEEIKQLKSNKENTNSSNSDADISVLIDQHLERKTEEQKIAANRAEAERALQEKFGSEAKATLEATAKELGVNPSFLIDVAAQSPKAFMKYFEGKEPNTPPATSAGNSINTIALGNKAAPTDPIQLIKHNVEKTGFDLKKDPHNFFKAMEKQLINQQ